MARKPRASTSAPAEDTPNPAPEADAIASEGVATPAAEEPASANDGGATPAEDTSNTEPEGEADTTNEPVPALTPPEGPSSPDGVGDDAAQTPAPKAPALDEAEQPVGDGAPSPVSGPISEPKIDGSDDAEIDPIGDLAGRTLLVRSIPKRGRRRAGMGFTPEATPVEVDDLTPDQIGMLLADPQLIVEID